MRSTLILPVLVCALVSAAVAQGQPAEHHRLAREILEELVNINTTPAGSTRQAAEAIAERLRQTGFDERDVQLVGPAEPPRKANLVVTLRGKASAKPILLMAHLDTVDAKREDWSTDPFTFVEQDGYFYGRGVNDNKAGVATIVANLIRWKREGYVPPHDIIALLTADEETDAVAGIQWLLKNDPRLRSAAFGLNADGGGGSLVNGEPALLSVQASEKVYADYQVAFTDRGGHSSVPRPADNPVYRLARGLARLQEHKFPIITDEVTRAALAAAAGRESGQLAADLRAVAEGSTAPEVIERLEARPGYLASLRTTCVATMLSGGHAVNALPQTASVNINCRILPSHDLHQLQQTLAGFFAPEGGQLTLAYEPVPSPPSPLQPQLMDAIKRVADKHFPGVSIVPYMSAGATDGLYVRNAGVPVYGVFGLFGDPLVDARAHGKDERIGARAFDKAVDHWYDLVMELAGR